MNLFNRKKLTISNTDLDKFRMGYVIAYKNSGDFFGNQIEKKQVSEGFSNKASQYVHVEISGGNQHSINISPPLSKCIDITKVHKGREFCLLRYKNDDYEKRGRYKVAYFSATLCNTRYDIRGILRFLWKWVKQSGRLWFCSEGCLWALQKVYPEAMNGLPPEDCMPASFLESDDFEIVWEGII